MATRSYSSKIVVSGDVIEIYDYDDEILEGFENSTSKGKGRSCMADDEQKQINRDRVFNRAKRDVRRLINTNMAKDSKFVTLTFAENIQDIKAANYEFKKFRQRLEYQLGFKLKYLAVIEFQKRGAVHYHVLMFNCPYIANKELSDIWSNGHIKINKIDNVDNVGAYVCKYMTKTDDERLEGEKMYFTSRSLSKPEEIKNSNKMDSQRIENLVGALPLSALTYENTFENEFHTTHYKQYNLKKV